MRNIHRDNSSCLFVFIPFDNAHLAQKRSVIAISSLFRKRLFRNDLSLSFLQTHQVIIISFKPHFIPTYYNFHSRERFSGIVERECIRKWAMIFSWDKYYSTSASRTGDKNNFSHFTSTKAIYRACVGDQWSGCFHHNRSVDFESKSFHLTISEKNPTNN